MKTLNRDRNITLDTPFWGNQPSKGAGMLVVIDPRVEDYSMLAAGVDSGASVVILDLNQDGVEQISEALASTSCTSLHIVCHGAPGSLELGKTPLSDDSLEQYNHLLQQ